MIEKLNNKNQGTILLGLFLFMSIFTINGNCDIIDITGGKHI